MHLVIMVCLSKVNLHFLLEQEVYPIDRNFPVLLLKIDHHLEVIMVGEACALLQVVHGGVVDLM